MWFLGARFPDDDEVELGCDVDDSVNSNSGGRGRDLLRWVGAFILVVSRLYDGWKFCFSCIRSLLVAEIFGGGGLGGGMRILSVCKFVLDLDLVVMLCLLGLGEGVLIFLFGWFIFVYVSSSDIFGLVAGGAIRLLFSCVGDCLIGLFG